MNKWYEVPQGLIAEIAILADKTYPFPKEGDMVLSQPVVMGLGKQFYVGIFRMEYDIFAGWIPLPHEKISEFCNTKAEAIDKYVELAKEA